MTGKEKQSKPSKFILLLQASSTEWTFTVYDYPITCCHLIFGEVVVAYTTTHFYTTLCYQCQNWSLTPSHQGK